MKYIINISSALGLHTARAADSASGLHTIYIFIYIYIYRYIVMYIQYSM